MASITMQASATIKSNTVEKALVELASFIKLLERDATKNPNNQDNISLAVSSSAQTITITFSIPCSNTRLTDGSFQLKAQNYFTGVVYTSGTTTDDLRGGTPLQDFIDLCQLVQAYEDDPTKNVLQANNITADFNSEPWRFEGTATLTYTEVISTAGALTISVKDYLS